MKYRLMTPGPAPVPEETLLELARPVPHHRTAECRQALRDVLEDLKYVYQTKHTVVPLTCSGTGGMEAALVNCVPRGGKALCLIAGRFGARWKGIAEAFGIEPVVVEVPLGQAVKPEQLEQALKQHADAAAVCTTLSETSTGVAHDIAAFGAIAKKTNALLLVDAISGLGAMEFRHDDWNVDICVTGSQKALMLPPGLAFLTLSPKASDRLDQNGQAPAYYFDLRKARDKAQLPDTPYTPAHTLIRALRVSLGRIRTEGIENLWARQALTARAARAGVKGMGLELFAETPADGLTVAKVPGGVDGADLLSRLEKKYGFKVAGGQDSLKGKILRLAHMGYIDAFDVVATLSALELVLLDVGFKVQPGSGLAAFQAELAKG